MTTVVVDVQPEIPILRRSRNVSFSSGPYRCSACKDGMCDFLRTDNLWNDDQAAILAHCPFHSTDVDGAKDCASRRTLRTS